MLKIANLNFKHVIKRKVQLLVLVSVVQSLFSVVAAAEPYLAVRYGLKCSACHANMTGGGKRTAVGNAYANGLTSNVAPTQFSPQLNDAISIGGNFRTNWTANSFPEPEQQEGDTAAPREIDDGHSFNTTSGVVFLEFALTDKLSFYIDQQVAPEGGRTREALVLYKGLFGQDSYLKAGQFYLPYGLRLQDDSAFIRQATRFNFNNADNGFELGWEPGPWSAVVAVTNGTQGGGENNQSKQVTFTGSYIQPNYRIGASFNQNDGPNDSSVTSYNVYSGLNIGKVTFLGEIDIIKNESGDDTIDQVASLVEANYLATTSLNVKLTYEYFEPNNDIDEDERSRINLIAEYFINQHFQLRVGTRQNDGIPQNPKFNQEIYFGELHLFF